MKSGDDSSSGPFQGLQAMADRVLGMLQDRLALLGVEVEEESVRLVKILAWTGALFLSAMMTLLFASLTLVWLFWDGGRTTVLVSLTLLYLLSFLLLVLGFRRYLSRQPRPFEASLLELDADRQCLHSRK